MSSIFQIAAATPTLRESLPPLVLRVLAVYFLCAIPAWIARVISGEQPGWLSPLIFQGVMLAATALLLHRSGITYRQTGLTRAAGWRWIGYLPLAAGVAALTSLVLIRSHSYFRTFSDPMSHTAALFWTGFYVPFAEELFLRGWFQTSLARALCALESRAVVLSSATVFAILHLGWYFRGRSGTGTLIIAVATFLLGWMCARARQQTQSVFPAIGIHAAFNVSGILMNLGINFILDHPRL